MDEDYIKNSYNALKDKNYNIFKCIYSPNNNKVRILGEKFVKKNKYKCKIIYKNKAFELKEWLEDIDENYNHNEFIKLKLKFVYNDIDISNLFEGCNRLLSVKRVSNGNSKKILIETSEAYLSEYQNKYVKLQMDNNNQIENNNLYRDKNELPSTISSLLIIKINNVENIDEIFFNKNNVINEIKGINKINTDKEDNLCRILLDYNKTNISNKINIINMANTFNGCNILKEVKIINSFNTSKVNNIISMFKGCNELENLDLSNFNTSNVTNMENMFN